MIACSLGSRLPEQAQLDWLDEYQISDRGCAAPPPAYVEGSGWVVATRWNASKCTAHCSVPAKNVDGLLLVTTSGHREFELLRVDDYRETELQQQRIRSGILRDDDSVDGLLEQTVRLDLNPASDDCSCIQLSSPGPPFGPRAHCGESARHEPEFTCRNLLE